MKIIVQEQAGVNSEHLKAFVAKVYSKHEDLERNFIVSMNSKLNKGIFSIDDENGLLAVVATTHQSIWHPYCVYVKLAYDFNRVNNRALQLMMDELKKKFEKPLFFLIDNRFESLDEVLLNKGMRFIRKTEIIAIKPQKREVQTYDRKVRTISAMIERYPRNY